MNEDFWIILLLVIGLSIGGIFLIIEIMTWVFNNPEKVPVGLIGLT